MMAHHIHIIVGTRPVELRARMREVADALLRRGRPFRHNRAAYETITTHDGLKVVGCLYDQTRPAEGYAAQTVTWEPRFCKTSSTNEDGSGQSKTYQRWLRAMEPYHARTIIFDEIRLEP